MSGRIETTSRTMCPTSGSVEMKLMWNYNSLIQLFPKRAWINVSISTGIPDLSLNSSCLSLQWHHISWHTFQLHPSMLLWFRDMHSQTNELIFLMNFSNALCSFGKRVTYFHQIKPFPLLQSEWIDLWKHIFWLSKYFKKPEISEKQDNVCIDRKQTYL